MGNGFDYENDIFGSRYHTVYSYNDFARMSDAQIIDTMNFTASVSRYAASMQSGGVALNIGMSLLSETIGRVRVVGGPFSVAIEEKLDALRGEIYTTSGAQQVADKSLIAGALVMSDRRFGFPHSGWVGNPSEMYAFNYNGVVNDSDIIQESWRIWDDSRVVAAPTLSDVGRIAGIMEQLQLERGFSSHVDSSRYHYAGSSIDPRTNADGVGPVVGGNWTAVDRRCCVTHA